MNKLLNCSGDFGPNFKVRVDLFVFDLIGHQLEIIGKNQEQSKYRTDIEALHVMKQDGSRSSVRPKALFWFRSDTETETQIG